MAEDVAFILSTASAAVDLSRKLYKIGGRAAGARKNINTVASNLILIASTLKQVALVLSTTMDIHTSHARHTARAVADQCENLFEEIEDLATPSNEIWDKVAVNVPNEAKRRFNVMEKICWTFEQPKVDLFLGYFDYLKCTLCTLFETLSLAILTTALRKDENIPSQRFENISASRIHIETLVYARHLSIATMEELHKECTINRPSRRSSPDGSESSNDRSSARHELAHTTLPSLKPSDVILLDGSMDFLKPAAPHDPALRRQSITLPHDVVDLLLQRWTKLGEASQRCNEPVKASAEDVNKDLKEENQLKKTTQSSILSTVSEVASPPELTLEKASTLGSSPEEERILPPPAANSSWSAIDRSSSSTPTIKGGNGRSIQENLYPLPPIQTSVLSPTQAFASLHRSVSNPEGNSFEEQRLRSEQGPLLGHDNDRLGVSRPSSRTSIRSQKQNTFPPADGNRSVASATNGIPTKSTYRAPYISSDRDELSSILGSDDEDFVDYPAAKRTGIQQVVEEQNSDTTKHVSESNNTEDDTGLEIPWRIRLTSKMYFDFIDKKHVGPRKNVDNIESIFNHPGAKTEISKEWVTERALFERGLRFVEVMSDSPNGPTPGVWRIHKPLAFQEIESLVERTIALYKYHEASQKRAPEAQIRSQPPPQDRGGPPPQPRLPHQPSDPGPLPIPIPQTNHRRTRSSSFNSNNSRPDLRLQNSPRSPSGAFPPSSYNPPGPQSQWPPSPLQRPRSSGDYDQGDRLREPRDSDGRRRYYEDRYSRGKSRERDSSRSSRRSTRSMDKDRIRSAGSKLTKLGSLAALLDGFDSLVL